MDGICPNCHRFVTSNGPCPMCGEATPPQSPVAIEQERCGVLEDAGKGSILAGHRGVPRQESCCPVGNWDQQTPIDDRWTICRACEHYRSNL